MLVIGYGNPGRMDDGLGPAFAERIAAARLPGVRVLADYQLTVEHAPALAEAGRVVFADAAVGMTGPFRFAPVEPARQGDISSHSLSPETLVALTDAIFGVRPSAHVLAIAGVEFGEVREGLSPGAQRNLDSAVAFFTGWVGSCADKAAVVD